MQKVLNNLEVPLLTVKSYSANTSRYYNISYPLIHDLSLTATIKTSSCLLALTQGCFSLKEKVGFIWKNDIYVFYIPPISVQGTQWFQCKWHISVTNLLILLFDGRKPPKCLKYFMFSLLLLVELNTCFLGNLGIRLTEPLVSLLQSGHCSSTDSIS